MYRVDGKSPLPLYVFPYSNAFDIMMLGYSPRENLHSYPF